MQPTAPEAARMLTQPVVGTADGVRVVGGDDGQNLLDGARITAVHVEGPVLWVLVERRHLYRIDGHGAELAASLDPSAAGTCVISHRGRIWVAGDDAGLWRLNGAALEPVSAFSHAPSRGEWYTPWGGPPSVFSMAGHGDDLYVGVHVGGIIRSSDEGRSWVPTIDLHDDVHQVVVEPTGRVWAATGNQGLAESTDRGASWHYHNVGLHGRYLLAVAVTADGLLVGASSGHASRDGGLYRFSGGVFNQCEEGLPDGFGGAVSPRHLAARGRDAVVSLPGGNVYTSADGGRSWSQIAADLPGVSEVALRSIANQVA